MISIVMGSASDKEIGKKVVDILKEFGIDYEVRVISAHRALDALEDYVKSSKSKIFISIAGKAAHLGGVIAGLTTRPVIGIPVKSSTLDGLDALLSTVQMPKGIPVATVAIDGGENAALLAISMLAIEDENLANKLKDYRKKLRDDVLESGKDLGL